jgi:hypothetical protein
VLPGGTPSPPLSSSATRGSSRIRSRVHGGVGRGRAAAAAAALISRPRHPCFHVVRLVVALSRPARQRRCLLLAGVQLFFVAASALAEAASALRRRRSPRPPLRCGAWVLRGRLSAFVARSR